MYTHVVYDFYLLCKISIKSNIKNKGFIFFLFSLQGAQKEDNKCNVFLEIISID